MGDLAAAVDNLLDHYEAFGARALKLEAMHGGPAATAFVQAGREFHYAWVERVFAPFLEVKHADDRQRLRAALVALCDVHTWRLLARHLDLPRAEVRATLLEALSRLTEEKT